MSCSTQDCLVCKLIRSVNNPIPHQELLTHVPHRLPDGTQYRFIHPGVDLYAANIYLAAELGYKPDQVFCHDHLYHYFHMKSESPEAQRQAALRT